MHAIASTSNERCRFQGTSLPRYHLVILKREDVYLRLQQNDLGAISHITIGPDMIGMNPRLHEKAWGIVMPTL